MKIQTLKGFRDFLPVEARKRQYVINTLQEVFASYGFEPLETPVLEYEEILAGKYGDEGDQLMYRFQDRGERNVAMRYDQTVPLARVVAQYQNELPMPFKRYQIQNVWRAENTQKGRYREFLQCDIDTVGSSSPLADAEIIAAAISCYKKLGLNNFKVLINDRQVFEGLSPEAIIILDKLKKIGEEKVCSELAQKKVVTSIADGEKLLQDLLDKKPTEQLENIFAQLDALGIDKAFVEFSPTLARGLNYYTGMIFEIETPDYPSGSIGSGGRYDELIGMFSEQQFPAVGFALGFDRTIEAMETLQLFPAELALSTTKVLVTVFSEELKQKSLEVANILRTASSEDAPTGASRSKNINTEIYLGEIKDKNPLEKQLKYAIAKNIPYLVIIGPEEAEKNVVTLKNLSTREQKQLTLEELVKTMKQEAVESEDQV